MPRRLRRLTSRCTLVAALLCAAGSSSHAREIAWRVLEPGLALAEIASPVKSAVGDSKVTALRALNAIPWLGPPG